MRLSEGAKKGIAGIAKLHRLSPSQLAEVLERAERAAGSPVALAELERDLTGARAGGALAGVLAVVAAGLRDEADGAHDAWGLEDEASADARGRAEALARAGEAEKAGNKGLAELLRGGVADAAAEEAAARAAAAALERQAAGAGAGEE